MTSQCQMNNCRAMCPDTEPFCAKHRGEPHGRTDWFAGDVDCDGNELITVRKDEWNTICEQREKFMWQVRDTCTRAEKAEAEAAEARAEDDDRNELIGELRDGVTPVGLHDDNETELFDIDGANETMFSAAAALERAGAEARAEVEREIVAWLRKPTTYVRGISMAQAERLSDAIERGDHRSNTP